MLSRLQPITTLILAASLVASIGACAGDPAPSGSQVDIDDAAVEATIERARAALAAGDVDGFVDQWTDAGLEQVFDEDTTTFASQTGYYVQAKQWSLGPATQTDVTGTTATTVAPLFFRLVGATRRFSLINQGGTWKIDRADLTTTTVHDPDAGQITLSGSSVDLGAQGIPDDATVFDVRNPTQDVHELEIMTVPAAFDTAWFFAHPELAAELPEGRSMPDGMDFFGGISAIQPGASVTMLLQHALPPGHYVFFCNVEDAAGVPHARRGEFADITIE